mmetsp:Transcript_21099/g.40893  ORF Transcript_21099/g.40893 Transcript_21099/m.40893 type:complete len:108 (-) Transcript_21099:1522-1845(-)
MDGDSDGDVVNFTSTTSMSSSSSSSSSCVAGDLEGVAGGSDGDAVISTKGLMLVGASEMGDIEGLTDGAVGMTGDLDGTPVGIAGDLDGFLVVVGAMEAHSRGQGLS